MSYQQKGLNRLSQINQTIFKARKSQEYDGCFETRNIKQSRAISSHNSRFIIDDDNKKLDRPQTSEGSKRKRIADQKEIKNNQCEILECNSSEDEIDQQKQSNYHVICNNGNGNRKNQVQVEFQTTLDQDFLSLFAND